MWGFEGVHSPGVILPLENNGKIRNIVRHKTKHNFDELPFITLKDAIHNQMSKFATDHYKIQLEGVL